MDQDRYHTDPNRLDEITKYFAANPTPPEAMGGQHVHIHYHQAPYNTEPVDQNKGQSVLEKYTPYFVMALGGFVILVGGTVILMFAFAAVAMILLVLLGAIAGLIVLAAVVTVLIKQHGESRSLRNLTERLPKARR